MRAPLALPLAAELHRHSAIKPTWTRLLSPFKVLLRGQGELSPELELPDGSCFHDHPLWETAARCLDFEVIRAKHSRRINIAQLSWLRSTLAIEAVTLASWSALTVRLLLALLRKSGLLPLESMLSFAAAWPYIWASGFTRAQATSAPANPSDDPTRGIPLRAAECERLAWWSAAELGGFWITFLSALPSVSWTFHHHQSHLVCGGGRKPSETSCDNVPCARGAALRLDSAELLQSLLALGLSCRWYNWEPIRLGRLLFPAASTYILERLGSPRSSSNKVALGSSLSIFHTLRSRTWGTAGSGRWLRSCSFGRLRPFLCGGWTSS